jgi:hypothetical protein
MHEMDGTFDSHPVNEWAGWKKFGYTSSKLEWTGWKIWIHIQRIGMDWMGHFTQHPLHPTKYLHFFKRSGLQMRHKPNHRHYMIFRNYLWNRNILRDHRSPKIFSAEELPFIESR